MKKELTIIMMLFVVLLPINIKALTPSVSLWCESKSLNPGETTACAITGTSNREISEVSLRLKVGSGLILSNIKKEDSWEGKVEEGRIELYMDQNPNKKGNFSIVTFSITANYIPQVSLVNVMLRQVYLYDRDFTEISCADSTETIRILSNNNILNDLTVDGKTIDGFTSEKDNYSLMVDSNKTTINIGAITNNTYSKITGDLGMQKLNYGTNNFNINVISESGEFKTYTLSIIKPEIRELKTLYINNEYIELIPGVYEYKHTLENEITSIDLKAELSNNKVNFVNGYGIRKIENIQVGENEILLKIKDNYNEELIYKIIVDRAINKQSELNQAQNMILKQNETKLEENLNGAEKNIELESKTPLKENQKIKTLETQKTKNNLIYIVLILIVVIGIGIYIFKKIKENNKI